MLLWMLQFDLEIVRFFNILPKRYADVSEHELHNIPLRLNSFVFICVCASVSASV